MHKLPLLSGRDVVSLLTKHFGFSFVSQKSSHIKLRKIESGKMVTTIVPDHPELARGTLRGILELAQIEIDDFVKFV